MEHITFLVAVVIVTALAFDFTNGFHDTANAMATSIATGALRPKVAVLIAGVLNIVGAFLSTEVAKTISGGIVDDTLVTPGMIFAGLVSAILWNLLTWLLGLPSSSSHALFGGLIGAVWVGRDKTVCTLTRLSRRSSSRRWRRRSSPASRRCSRPIRCTGSAAGRAGSR